MRDADTRDMRRRRAELRTTVLCLGRLLGWGSRDVIAFAEAVTDRPWRRCGCAEFERVVEEYWAIGRVIEEKRARQRELDRIEGKGEHRVAAR
ncbi:MAG TPA: hypothetical protein VFB58_05110 [Chloroflexota bacterium]|nr:hypothetical protein [Chloroflexota bacterium]